MRTLYRVLFLLILLGLAGCIPTGAGVPETGASPAAPRQVTEAQGSAPEVTLPPTATEPPEPLPTATAAPAFTPTPAVLPLELVEWGEFPYANLADPQNTDTHIEALIHNPNPFPVRISREGAELRFLNATGEVVYRNPSPRFYIWEGEWMRADETLAISACVCFQSSGLERQAWETLELVAPLEAAAGAAYTTDIEATMGDFIPLYGGSELGTEISLKNTGDQALKGFDVLVLARDAAGKFVGVAVAGLFAESDANGNYARIEPGMSGGGVLPSEIDYVNEPLVYELLALGIPME